MRARIVVLFIAAIILLCCIGFVLIGATTKLEVDSPTKTNHIHIETVHYILHATLTQDVTNFTRMHLETKEYGTVTVPTYGMQYMIYDGDECPICEHGEMME